MSHQRPLTRRCIVAGALALLLASCESLSYGITGCSPETPCPCSADGVCRPNRATWGVSRTKWRPWPGESAGMEPTPEAQAGPEGEEGVLLPFETPSPQKEYLRGPEKSKAEKAAEGAAEGEAAPEEALPGPVELPGFDPQGRQLPPQQAPLEVPSLDDAPPALPQSLRQTAALMNLPTISQAAPAAHGVQQVHWQVPTDIGLVNPATAIVTSPEEQPLQQAIYYEATDLEMAQ